MQRLKKYERKEDENLTKIDENKKISKIPKKILEEVELDQGQEKKVNINGRELYIKFLGVDLFNNDTKKQDYIILQIIDPKTKEELKIPISADGKETVFEIESNKYSISVENLKQTYNYELSKEELPNIKFKIAPTNKNPTYENKIIYYDEGKLGYLIKINEKDNKEAFIFLKADGDKAYLLYISDIQYFKILKAGEEVNINGKKITIEQIHTYLTKDEFMKNSLIVLKISDTNEPNSTVYLNIWDNENMKINQDYYLYPKSKKINIDTKSNSYRITKIIFDIVDKNDNVVGQVEVPENSAAVFELNDKYYLVEIGRIPVGSFSMALSYNEGSLFPFAGAEIKRIEEYLFPPSKQEPLNVIKINKKEDISFDGKKIASIKLNSIGVTYPTNKMSAIIEIEDNKGNKKELILNEGEVYYIKGSDDRLYAIKIEDVFLDATNINNHIKIKVTKDQNKQEEYYIYKKGDVIYENREYKVELIDIYTPLLNNPKACPPNINVKITDKESGKESYGYYDYKTKLVKFFDYPCIYLGLDLELEIFKDAYTGEQNLIRIKKQPQKMLENKEDQKTTKEEVLVYPNPAKTQTLTVQFFAKEQTNYYVQIINNKGQEVLAEMLEKEKVKIEDKNQIQLNIENISNGIYNILITDQNGRYIGSSKVVIAR
jgi:hypothetical protein